MAETRNKQKIIKKPIVHRKHPLPTPATPAAVATATQKNDAAQSLIASIPGLPADVAANILRIFQQGGDVGTALAYIRGSDWYKTAYAGIGAGIQSGLFSGDTPETQYRAYMSQVKDSFQRNYGRVPTTTELLGYMQKGLGVSDVEQIGSGHAWAAANAPDVQYELGAFGGGQITPGALQSLGEQNAGRNSDLGLKIQTSVQRAIDKMNRVFQGQLATPNFNLGSGGLNAPSLNPKQTPDIPR